MGTVTYPDERVSDYVSEHFVPWRVDYSQASELLRRFNVFWTPQALVLDEHAQEYYRVVGYLPPDTFLAHLAMGRAKVSFSQHQYKEAAERFDGVARDFGTSSRAPEAIYFRAVSRYKTSEDSKHLDEAAAELQRSYPASEWTMRTQPWLPAKVGIKP